MQFFAQTQKKKAGNGIGHHENYPIKKYKAFTQHTTAPHIDTSYILNIKQFNSEWCIVLSVWK